MSALCVSELRRDEAWDRIRRDPELLEAVMAANRPRLTEHATAVAGLLTLDTADHPEHEADQC